MIGQILVKLEIIAQINIQIMRYGINKLLGDDLNLHDLLIRIIAFEIMHIVQDIRQQVFLLQPMLHTEIILHFVHQMACHFLRGQMLGYIVDLHKPMLMVAFNHKH